MVKDDSVSFDFKQEQGLNSSSMKSLDLIIPRDQIAYVRFILEAYEGLAVQTSDPGSSEVRWLVPESRLPEALRLLTVLGKEARVEIRKKGDLEVASGE